MGKRRMEPQGPGWPAAGGQWGEASAWSPRFAQVWGIGERSGLGVGGAGGLTARPGEGSPWTFVRGSKITLPQVSVPSAPGIALAYLLCTNFK